MRVYLYRRALPLGLGTFFSLVPGDPRPHGGAYYDTPPGCAEEWLQPLGWGRVVCPHRALIGPDGRPLPMRAHLGAPQVLIAGTWITLMEELVHQRGTDVESVDID